jgi:hypothetical protein
MATDGNVATYQFDWRQIYLDPPQYQRTMGPGIFGVPIAKGAYPSGYRIPNGQPGGGFPPTGAQSNGTLPIRLQPPVSGTGRITFVTHLKVRIGNPGKTVIQVAGGLGVSNVSQVSQPMFPYLGVGHDQDPISGNLVFSTLPPGQVISVDAFRLDIVDNAFATVPNWPNWQMVPGKDLLWPAVTPIINIKGGPAMIMGIFCFGFAT